MSRKSWSVRGGIGSGNGHTSKTATATVNKSKATQLSEERASKKKNIQQFDDRIEQQLWYSFFATRKDEAYRKALIKRYAGLATHEANVYFSSKLTDNRTVDINDLISDATIGLLHAIDSFNTDYGVKFEVFARIRIRGAIIDGLRRIQHFPRIIAKHRREVLPLFEAMQNALCRTPTVDEFCQKYGENYRHILEDPLLWSNVHNASSAYSQQTGEDIQSVFDNAINKVEDVPDVHRLNLISKIDKILNNMDMSIIITMYYFNGNTNKYIATVRGQSTSSIVTKHKAALEILKSRGSEIFEELGLKL